MTMNSFERRNKIIQLVNEQGTVLVQDLAGVFAASEATIRADLRFLEQKGVVTRFHGDVRRSIGQVAGGVRGRAGVRHPRRTHR